MKNQSPELQRATKELAGMKDAYRDTDVVGNQDVAEQILKHMSPHERAGIAIRSDGTKPSSLTNVDIQPASALESSQEERRRIADQRRKTEAAYREDAVERGALATERVLTAIGGDERIQKARAQALLFRQTAEEMTDPKEKMRWEEKAEKAEAGILVEDGDVSLARIKAMKESRQELRSDIAEEKLYDSKGPLGKLGIRIRELFKGKGS